MLSGRHGFGPVCGYLLIPMSSARLRGVDVACCAACTGSSASQTLTTTRTMSPRTKNLRLRFLRITWSSKGNLRFEYRWAAQALNQGLCHRLTAARINRDREVTSVLPSLRAFQICLGRAAGNISCSIGID